MPQKLVVSYESILEVDFADRRWSPWLTIRTTKGTYNLRSDADT
jgi:hypothetical protein